MPGPFPAEMKGEGGLPAERASGAFHWSLHPWGQKRHLHPTTGPRKAVPEPSRSRAFSERGKKANEGSHKEMARGPRLPVCRSPFSIGFCYVQDNWETSRAEFLKDNIGETAFASIFDRFID